MHLLSHFVRLTLSYGHPQQRGVGVAALHDQQRVTLGLWTEETTQACFNTTSTLDARKTPFWWRLDLIAKISPSSMRAAR